MLNRMRCTMHGFMRFHVMTLHCIFMISVKPHLQNLQSIVLWTIECSKKPAVISNCKISYKNQKLMFFKLPRNIKFGYIFIEYDWSRSIRTNSDRSGIELLSTGSFWPRTKLLCNTQFWKQTINRTVLSILCALLEARFNRSSCSCSCFTFKDFKGLNWILILQYCQCRKLLDYIHRGVKHLKKRRTRFCWFFIFSWLFNWCFWFFSWFFSTKCT